MNDWTVRANLSFQSSEKSKIHRKIQQTWLLRVLFVFSDCTLPRLISTPQISCKSLRSIQTHRQQDWCNNSLQHKLAAKLYFESSSAKKKKKEKKNQQIMHCTTQHIQITFERIVMWSYRAHKHELRMIAIKAPVTLYHLWMRKDAAAPLCYLPKWCGSCGEIFLGMKKSSPTDLKMTKRAGLSGAVLTLSLLETELPNLISVNLFVLCLICPSHWRPMLHCWWGILMLRSAPRTHSSAIMQGQVLNLHMH